MGVANFLGPVLESAGRYIDLSNHERLRIAIDVSTFIYQACTFNGDMLADERHLSAFGRATLLYHHHHQQQQQEQQQQQQQPSLHNPQGIEDSVTETLAEQPEKSRSEQKLEEFVAKCCTDVVQKVLDLQSCAKQVLVVLDGRTPPIKANTTHKRRQERAIHEQERERGLDMSTIMDDDDNHDSNSRLEGRLKGNRRAGAGNQHYGTVVDAIVETLRSHCIPFLVAPYEADGQLAFLLQGGYVDLVVTEDSDLIAYMACGGISNGVHVPILYKLSRNPVDGRLSRGCLLRRDDVNGASTWKKPAKLNLGDFSPAMMACVFAAAGCDYCPSLHGIGSVGATAMVRQAFLRDESPPTSKTKLRELGERGGDKHSDDDDDDAISTNSNTALGRLLDLILLKTYDRSKMTNQEKQDFKNSFLSAVFMFRHCIVYDPVLGECRNLTQSPDVELITYKPYLALCEDPPRIQEIVGERLPSPLATHIAEGWICPRTLRPRNNVKQLPEYVQADLDDCRKEHCSDAGDHVDEDEDDNEDCDEAPNPDSQLPSTPFHPISVREARLSLTPTPRNAIMEAISNDSGEHADDDAALTTQPLAEISDIGTSALKKRAAVVQTVSSKFSKVSKVDVDVELVLARKESNDEGDDADADANDSDSDEPESQCRETGCSPAPRHMRVQPAIGVVPDGESPKESNLSRAYKSTRVVDMETQKEVVVVDLVDSDEDNASAGEDQE